MMTDVTIVRSGFEPVIEAINGAATVVADRNVDKLYPKFTHDGAVIFPAGEKSKDAQALLEIIEVFHDKNIKRSDTIVALGGGVTGDLAGLAAALYMRGIDYINVPTSLLAMVDSCIGGKVAIDHCGVKNLIGAFHAPVRTIIAPDFLRTLPEREIKSGIGEIVKTCLLTQNAFAYLRDNINILKARDVAKFIGFIELCVRVKSEAVSRDPYERGLRRVLNVGHTVGHALESVNGYKLGHGEYVLMGMLAECAMFRELIAPDYYAELADIFGAFADPPRTSENAVLKAALSDKKNGSDDICVMLPTDIGEVTEVRVQPSEFKARYARAVAELRKK